jgi:flagellar hook-associated protein 1 FlgK
VSFVTLQTGLSGLRTSQVAVDTASHNVANASTVGYTRQRVATSTGHTYVSRDGQVGTGVKVDDIVRLRDTFLDTRVRESVGAFMSHDRRSVSLQRLEVVYGEPDDGITEPLNELWARFEDLALDPANPANRTIVLSQLDELTSRIRDIAAASEALRTDTASSHELLVSETQELLTQVATINEAVQNRPPDEISNTLLDDRDRHLDRLAELVGATSTAQADGSVTVHLGSETLVAGTTASSVTAASNGVQVNSTTVPYSAYSGELAGAQAVLLEDIPAVQASLEDFVSQLADAINSQNAAGFTEDGSAGGSLLSFTSGDAAGTIALMAITIDDLALQGTATSGRHDSTNATALADLRTATRGDGRTHDDALRTTVVSIGARVATANRSAASAAEVATNAEVNRTSVHGVSLDEEMVSLVQYQRALEANSRMMTAADEMLDQIINRMGVVGR